MHISRRIFTKMSVGLAATGMTTPKLALAQDVPAPPPDAVPANPLDALDGEKLRAVINGERVVVRLIGCDAPEPEVEENTTECGFLESRWVLSDKVAGNTLLLEADAEDKDKKERLWRHVWLVNADGSNGGLLKQQMLAEGWRTTHDEEKTTTYAAEYAAAASEAETNKAGILSMCEGFHQEINRRGGHDDPASVGENIQVKGVQAVLNGYYFSYTDALGSAAKGGYKYLIANVTITNLRESGKYRFSDTSFAAKDLATAADYDDEFAFLNSPLGSGELSAGEYATGDVAIEVQETATDVRLKYNVEGDFSLYWLTPA